MGLNPRSLSEIRQEQPARQGRSRCTGTRESSGRRELDNHLWRTAADPSLPLILWPRTAWPAGERRCGKRKSRPDPSGRLKLHRGFESQSVILTTFAAAGPFWP